MFLESFKEFKKLRSLTGLGMCLALGVILSFFFSVQLSQELKLTFSFLPEEHRAALRYCGSHSGREGDKFAAAGLTPLFADTDTPAPFPAEASLVVVGRKIYEDDLREGCFLDPSIFTHYRDKDYHRFFICEIEEVLVRAD